MKLNTHSCMRVIFRILPVFLLAFLLTPLAVHAESITFERVLRTYQEQGFPGALWDFPFKNAKWLSDDSLVITGYCNVVDGNRGGLYLFDGNGVYRSTQNTCLDTGSLHLGCPEGGGCQMGAGIAEKAPYIIREGQSSGIRRSPVVYSKSGNNLSYVSRLFFTESSDEEWYPNQAEGWEGYYEPVVVGDVLVMQKGGVGGANTKLVGLSIPNLNVLWEEPYKAIAGALGDILVVGRSNFPIQPLITELIAYRVSSSGLTELNHLPGLRGNLRVDAQNPSIGAVAGPLEGSATGGCKVVRLRKTASGIEMIDERIFPTSCGANYSISGDYVAFALGTLGMRVWKGTTEIVFSQPAEVMYEPGSGQPPRFNGLAMGIDIRDDGKIALTSGGKVILYSISGASTSTPPVPPNPFPTSTISQIPGQSLSVVYSTTSTPPPRLRSSSDWPTSSP